MTREAFLAWRQGWRGDVVGTHLDGEEDFRKASYRAPALLVMGSEGPGLSEPLVECLHAACEDSDGGATRLAQPGGGDGPDALSDPRAPAGTVTHAH